MGNKIFCYKICTQGFIVKEAVFFYEKVGSKAPLRFNDPFLIKKYIQFDIQHAPSRPLQKFPDTPKYPEALKNVK